MSVSFMPLCLVLLCALVACSPPSKSEASTSAQVTQTTQTAPAKPSAQSSAQPRLPRPSAPADGLPMIARADLPPEGQRTLSLIVRGGPFASGRDGVVFGNRERLLPRLSGTYREYTVPTPGASDRGARRIVCGPPLRSAAGCYYTADHYASFKRIAP